MTQRPSAASSSENWERDRCKSLVSAINAAKRSFGGNSRIFSGADLDDPCKPMSLFPPQSSSHPEQSLFPSQEGGFRPSPGFEEDDEEDDSISPHLWGV